ncbi:McrC family protein [Haloarcula marina]|uniref:McrC family protein n=1 Tax=Haloarcula marina TaxID=2961574 RepID=UPI0020B6C4D2|nr:McrC family protein [Halomicroarcula marina]
MTESKLESFYSDLEEDYDAFLDYWEEHREEITEGFDRQRILLPENIQTPIPQSGNKYDLPGLTNENVRELLSAYGSLVGVTFPAENTDNIWVLTNEGYAGSAVLSGGWSIELRPKVPFDNILSVESYVGGLESFEFYEQFDRVESVEGVYERLAEILASEVSTLGNRGLDKSYETQEVQSSFIRGSIDFSKSSREAWNPQLHMKTRELTTDTENNQLILWTLHKILESHQFSPEIRHNIRRAYKILENHVSLEPYSPQDCLRKVYNRQNQIYEKIHGLCYFFLKALGPTIQAGERITRPYTVHMPTLYEEYISKWLDEEFLPEFQVESKVNVQIDDDFKKRFEIDFLLFKRNEPICVMDAKYKIPSGPSPETLQQLAAYAISQGLNEALIIHPYSFENRVNMWVGPVRIRDIVFPLSSDIHSAGIEFNDEFSNLSNSFLL